MTKHLVVVESPAKAKTLKKFLGPDYEIKASVGHVIDLPDNAFGVDIDHDFAPNYQVIRGKGPVLKDIKDAAKHVDEVLLAPDPDREGEAIAWHLGEFLKKEVKGVHVRRITFNEITNKAVQEAVKAPRDIDTGLFEAQQARRILDRIVGYRISPLLWDKVRRGLSAGRVQSVAVRLVVDREKEILRFVPEEYWTLAVTLAGPIPPEFTARLVKLNDKRAERVNGDVAKAVGAVLAKTKTLTVASVDKKERKRNPYPPFITSKLQQDAAARFGFSAQRTMQIAQALYQGVELGAEGSVGLITYMRTDSVRLSEDAIVMARAFITENYGDRFVPAEPQRFRGKKDAQDAHEAIRPTSTVYTPEKVRPYLTAEQQKLYELIWNRFLACQMTPAVYEQTTVEFPLSTPQGEATLRASGQRLLFEGWRKVFGVAAEGEVAEEAKDGDGGDVATSSAQMPPLKAGDECVVKNPAPEQHFTEPPARYSEGTLVKELEEQGIGRPSTYASIMSTIVEKGYVEKRAKNLAPTELGNIVTELLVEAFPQLLDVRFTAQMENQLDAVEDGSVNWVRLLKDFYGPFDATLDIAKEKMRDVKRMEIATDVVCNKCGSKMVIKFGKNGSFLGCSNYPACRNTSEYKKDDEGRIVPLFAEVVPWHEPCPTCNGRLLIKSGRYGKYIGCENNPECPVMLPLPVASPPCPTCASPITMRMTKFNKPYYSCMAYPDCTFIAWDMPYKKPCPKCDKPYLVIRETKTLGLHLACIDRACGHKETLEERPPEGDLNKVFVAKFYRPKPPKAKKTKLKAAPEGEAAAKKVPAKKTAAKKATTKKAATKTSLKKAPATTALAATPEKPKIIRRPAAKAA
jgi:DNA topoisomerase I